MNAGEAPQSANVGSNDGHFNGMGQGAHRMHNHGLTPTGAGILTEYNPNSGLTEAEIEERNQRIARGAERKGRSVAYEPQRVEIDDEWAWNLLSGKFKAQAVIVTDSIPEGRGWEFARGHEDPAFIVSKASWIAGLSDLSDQKRDSLVPVGDGVVWGEGQKLLENPQIAPLLELIGVEIAENSIIIE